MRRKIGQGDCSEPNCNKEIVTNHIRCEGEDCLNMLGYCEVHFEELEIDNRRTKCIYCREDVIVNSFGEGPNEYLKEN